MGNPAHAVKVTIPRVANQAWRVQDASPTLASSVKWGETFLRWAVRMRWVWRKEGKRAFLHELLKTVLTRPYHTWAATHQPGAGAMAEQRSTAAAFAYRPLISVVSSVREHAPLWLEASIRSLLAQSYDRWELDLVEIAEDTPAKVIAETWAARDSRVRLHRADPPERGSLFLRGRGEFVMLLGAGDTLADHALFDAVELLNRRPDADLIYFDEDRLSTDGRRRCDPFFKPDWSPELLCSVNYLAHAMLRRRLVEAVAVDREPSLETHAWDVLLRCTEHAGAIVHIPKVLYHQRATARTPPLLRDDLSRGQDQRRHLAEHLQRLGARNATAAVAGPGVIRVTWPPAGATVSIIIPNKDKAPVLQQCLSALTERTSYRNFEILIVDTGSTDAATRDYYAGLASHPHIRILDHPGPFNYSKANNAGVKHATGQALLFLNNDTEAIDPDWLEEMVRWAERPEIGVVGAKLLYADGAIQHAGVVIGMNGLAEHIYRFVQETYTGIFGSVNWYRNYMAVTGACMMMRRDVFEEVGGFDETYQVAFSDFDICLRVVTHGYRVLYTPFARLFHHEGATRGQRAPIADTRRAIGHMQRLIEAGDPYFNPNLSYESPVPALPRRGDRSRTALLRHLMARTGIEATTR